MRRWNRLSAPLVSTERVVSTSIDATPGRDGRDGSTTRPSVRRAGIWRLELVVTSGHTTTSNPQMTPLFTSSTATDPSASVSSTVPVRPPLLRLPLNAPDRMSVSGSHRHPIEGRLPVSGSTRASTFTVGTSGRTRGCEPMDQSEDLVQGSLQLGVGHGIAQPHPAVVGERAARHQRDTFLLHELLAESAPGERLLLADPVDAEEEVERAVRLDELDARCLAAEPLDQQVPPAAERGHHAGDLGIHLLVGERGRG